jgi:hypothetical protein
VIDPGKVLEIVEAFNREGVEYKVFGGMAVNYLGLNRNTEHADFFVDPSPENVARIKTALRSIWDDPNIDEIKDDDMIGDYPSFQYNPPDADYWIDVVSRLGEAFAYADLPVTVIEIRGVKINVVTPQTLYDMKKNTIRYKDKIDAYNLRERYDVKD